MSERGPVGAVEGSAPVEQAAGVCEHGRTEAHWYPNPACEARWPECISEGYDPRCCRFPKSCSADERCLGPADQSLPLVPRDGLAGSDEAVEDAVDAAARTMYGVEPEALQPEALQPEDWQAAVATARAMVAAALPFIAAHVRAEAVAEERQRIIGELQSLIAKPLEWERDIYVRDGYRHVLEIVAAGSGSVATPVEPAAPCICDGAAYFSAAENAARHPFLIDTDCLVHGGGADSVAAPSVGTGTPVEEATTAERRGDRPVEIASLPIEELPDWADLAEAVGATLHNVTVGCSDEYETEMRWPDGRVATYRDRLAIISADSELRPTEWQLVFERMQANHAAELRSCRAAVEEADELLRNPPFVGWSERLRTVFAAALGDGE